MYTISRTVKAQLANLSAELKRLKDGPVADTTGLLANETFGV